MNLLLYIEFDDGTETVQWTFDDMRGVPIPLIGDCICPGRGEYRIKNRTISYTGKVMTVYINCTPAED